MSNFDASRMLSFDLETTSVNPREARIVTSAMVRIDGREVDPVELLADPGIEIPPETTAIHGISTEYAREHGRPHDEVLAESIQRIRAGWRDGLTLIVFNASYDLTILRSQSPEFTVDGLVYDPFVIDKLKDKYRKGKRTLTDLCAHYSVRLDTAHEATSDALAAARIAWKQIKMWPELAAMSAEELMEFQAVGYYEMQTDFKKYLEGRGRDTTTVNTSWPMQG
ncbi:3'-5' exonuclease [Corynebacterium occultum]|nr:3'-5' exonuclease [Corynebacterium occultum]